jgi:hypothetical protein
MSMRAKRFTALVVAIAATSVSALSLASSAEAAPCGTRAGVTIVVQYGDPLGTSVGCATGDPATGLEALKSLGHRYTFVPRQPGFLCTIDDRPDPCNNGPANAYWSYWHAQPGGAWSYGSIGAGSYDPPSGSVEGWAFGSGKPPRSRPPALGTSSNTSSGSAASGTGATGGTAAEGRTSASATRNLTPDGRGGLGGLVGGLGLIVLLGGLAAYLARRRPRVGS